MGAYELNLADRTASAMASSATGVVRKQGNADGSPWPRGITGLLSSSLRFDRTLPRTPLMVTAAAIFSSWFPWKPHLFFDPFSISSFFSFSFSGVVLFVSRNFRARKREFTARDLSTFFLYIIYDCGLSTRSPTREAHVSWKTW